MSETKIQAIDNLSWTESFSETLANDNRAKKVTIEINEVDNLLKDDADAISSLLGQWIVTHLHDDEINNNEIQRHHTV